MYTGIVDGHLNPYTHIHVTRRTSPALSCVVVIVGWDEVVKRPMLRRGRLLHLIQTFHLSQELPHPRQVDVLTALTLNGSMEAENQVIELALFQT